jgi:hypothetical protein
MSDYFEVEERVQAALAYKTQHPKASFRFLARQFNASKDRIHRRWKGKDSKSTRSPTNLRLDKEQDKALCWYIERLNEIGVSLRYKFIAAAANSILQIATPPGQEAPTVSDQWPARWLRQHPQFERIREKCIERERQRAMNTQEITGFFERYKKTVNDHNVQDEDIWNMDETGLRVSVSRGQWVIVPTTNEKNRFTNLIGSLGDTEHITVVESISAAGAVIPPLIIIKGVVIQTRWFTDIADNDIAIGVSDSGYSNDILCFQWLQHWARFTYKPNQGYRLLIMDGYKSYLSF